MKKQPQVGVGVIVIRKGQVLLGQRRGSHGEGFWGFPGGHLDFMETIEACAAREVWEETGLEIRNIRLGPYTNDCFTREHKHYVTLYVTASCPQGEPLIKEPAKCERWAWYPWSNLPTPLFLPIANLLESGYVPR